MKVVAIIQARMGSTRLPGKVMMSLDGHPVLEWCVRACKYAPGVDEVWIATSTLPADDVIVQFFNKQPVVKVYRGSETDVLDRFHKCAQAANADIILRLTGDCPFLDPQVIGGVVRLMKQSPGCHFASNISPRTYPDGLDVQAMSWTALDTAWSEATRPIDRDGVCTFIERNRSRFPAETLINPIYGLEGERWVLDTADDLRFCDEVARGVRFANGPPSMLDILDFLDRKPEVRSINSTGVMNERYFAALAEEEIYERTFEASQKAFRRAKAIIPIGAQTFSKSYLQFAQPSPLYVTHGQGALVWDVDGNEYVDLVSALLPNILGYRDGEVDAAIRRQLNSGCSFSLSTELEQQLAAELIRLIPCAEMVRFGKSGTDVTTAAIRAARAFTGRDRILICGGYHGWADWSVERNLGVPEEVRKLTVRCKRGDEPLIYHGDFAAVIVEPDGDPEHLRRLRELCDGRHTLLIFDEVITGFRWHLGGAQAYYKVTPDLACFGKAMANGMPLSAVVGRKDIMAKFAPPDNIFYSGTFFGEALSLAAGIATIEKLERNNVIPKLWDVGGTIEGGVRRLIEQHHLKGYIGTIGESPRVRVIVNSSDIEALFRKEMVNSGVLITNSHNISAAHGPNEIKRILKSYDHALSVVRDAMEKGEVGLRLAGAAITQGVRV